MSTRAAPDKGLMMRHVSGHHQVQPATSLTSLTTEDDIVVRFPHKRWECPLFVSALII
jgi:hypothetical protein